MGKQTDEFQPPPACHGCEKCGKCDENALYSLQHGGVYLCSKCFFGTPIGQRWPTPVGAADAEVSMEPISVTLTADEVADVRKYGEARARKEDRLDRGNKPGAKVLKDLVGLAGEVAVARWTGGEWDRGIYKGGDEYDVTLPCGCKVGVRTADATKEDNKRYTVLGGSKTPTEPPSKATVGCILRPHSVVEVHGVWVPESDFEIKNFKYGDRAAVKFTEMDGPERVLEHIEKCKAR